MNYCTRPVTAGMPPCGSLLCKVVAGFNFALRYVLWTILPWVSWLVHSVPTRNYKQEKKFRFTVFGLNYILKFVEKVIYLTKTEKIWLHTICWKNNLLRERHKQWMVTSYLPKLWTLTIAVSHFRIWMVGLGKLLFTVNMLFKLHNLVKFDSFSCNKGNN